ncbi:MAG: hypothetical protein V4642_05025 [Bacteroidota bacterium]
MKKLATIFTMAFCAIAIHSVAFAQADILLTGKITDEATGKAVSAKYEIVDSEGKKVQGKSNSVGGAYQAILKAGQDYTINITSFDILKKTEVFSIPASAKYIEHSQDFTVKKLVTGTHLYTLHAFDANQSSVLPTVNTELGALRDVLKQNRLLKVIIQVGSNDTEFPKPKPVEVPKAKAKAKPKKGSKKGEVVVPVPDVVISTEPVISPEQQLMNNRIAALKEYFADVRNAEERIKYVCEVPGTATTAKTKTGIANLTINVGEVKDMFE